MNEGLVVAAVVGENVNEGLVVAAVVGENVNDRQGPERRRGCCSTRTLGNRDSMSV